MTIRVEALTYQADGLAMVGELFFDDAKRERRPAVLLFPDAFGLGEQVRSRAKQLAELGFAALACDLHGQRRVLTDLQEITSTLQSLRASPTRIRARARGALDAVLQRPEVDESKLAAIGYCFGGTMALELARSGAALAATVGFHSGLQTEAPQDAGRIKGRVLVCIGADDPSIPPEQRTAFENEMRSGGVDWQLHLYGGVVHSFTNPDADKLGRPQFARFNAEAAAHSWSEMLSLFDKVFQR